MQKCSHSLPSVTRKKLKDNMQRSCKTADRIVAIHVVLNLTPNSKFELRNNLKDTMVRHAPALVQHLGFGEAVTCHACDLFRRKMYARR
jgi:hypothetical protein